MTTIVFKPKITFEFYASLNEEQARALSDLALYAPEDILKAADEARKALAGK